MTRRIHPLVTFAVVVLTVAITLTLSLLAGRNAGPAELTPPTTVVFTRSTQADGQMLVCGSTGGCALDESTPFTVTRPPAVLPTETPATICTFSACVIAESTPFSVVR